MGVRRITLQEYEKADQIKRVAFLRTTREEAKNEADRPEEIFESIWAYFDDDERMTARVRNIDYTMFFDGQKVRMGGISAVSSLPEARGKGRVRAILHGVLSEDRSNGVMFSVLSPFSQPYYRQFGYAVANQVSEYTFSLECLLPYAKTPFQARLHQPGDPLDDFNAVHNAASARYNMALVRTNRQWLKMMGGDPYLHRDYRYVFYDDQAAPVGYLIFAPAGEDPLDIHVTDLDYVDENALMGILSFLSGLRAQVRNVTLKMPPRAKFYQYLPNADLAKHRFVTHDMARVIHVQKVLETMRMPQGTGSFTIEVKDAFLSENEGIYEVQYRDGHVQTVAKVQSNSDLSVDIADFTQLALGVMGLEEIAYRDTVQILGNQKTLSKVFVEKDVYMADHF